MKRITYGLVFILVFSILVTFCPFDIYKAAETDGFIEYTSDLINEELYISYDSRNYTKFNLSAPTPIEASVYYMQIRLYFLEPLPGNSTVNFNFIMYEHNLDDVEPVFLHSHILSSGTVIKTLSSAYFDFVYYGTETHVSSKDISFDKSGSTEVNCITLYFKVDLSSSSEQISTPGLGNASLMYSTPSQLDVIVTPTPEQQETINKYDSETAEKTGKLDSLVSDKNSMSKPDSDSLSGSVDTYIDMDDVSAFSTVLAVFFDNKLILAYLMIVLSVALISFVLFGKKG